MNRAQAMHANGAIDAAVCLGGALGDQVARHTGWELLPEFDWEGNAPPSAPAAPRVAREGSLTQRIVVALTARNGSMDLSELGQEMPDVARTAIKQRLVKMYGEKRLGRTGVFGRFRYFLKKKQP